MSSDHGYVRISGIYYPVDHPQFGRVVFFLQHLQGLTLSMPATIQSPGEHQSLNNTMGAMLLGILASSILYGVSLVQAFFYYSRASLIFPFD